jgi:hypothetical protein
MIGRDKILYYYYRYLKNPPLFFYLIYGFYDVNKQTDNIDKITYRFINITDILETILKDYKLITYYKAKYFMIPIKDLKKLKECPLFNLQ